MIDFVIKFFDPPTDTVPVEEYRVHVAARVERIDEQCLLDYFMSVSLYL